MSKTSLFISLEEPNWEKALPNYGELSNSVVAAVFDHLGTSALEALDLDPDKPAIINLSLNNDAQVRQLNNEFRNIDKPTNVLSFASIDDPDFFSDIEIYDEIELGSIIIALETMQREADILKISLQDHYCHLFMHGILHLLGFDHIEDDEAKEMEELEVEILAKLNIANPYVDQ